MSAKMTEMETGTIRIRVNGEELEGFAADRHEYCVYVEKNEAVPVVAAWIESGDPCGNLQIIQAERVPDCAIVTVGELHYRIRFIQKDVWTSIGPDGEPVTVTKPCEEPAHPYYGDRTGKPERPWRHDYSQTYVTKFFLSTPDEELTCSKVCLHFDEVLELVKKLDVLTLGVPKIVYLVGWHGIGHDTFYPDWQQVNPYLCCGLKDGEKGTKEQAAADLNRLMREARRYNTTISLHLNSTDAYQSGPLWELYSKNGLIAQENGQDKKNGCWAGGVAYQVNYTEVWNSGFYKDQVDGLLRMLPELKTAGTVHSDAFHARGGDDFHSLQQEEAARRQMIRYWQDCGVDLTSEHIWSSEPNAPQEEMNGNHPEGGMVGIMPFAWMLWQREADYFRRPVSLLTGVSHDEEALRWLYGTSNKSEPFFTEAGVHGTRPGWERLFIADFCRTALCYFYQNQFANVERRSSGNEWILLKEENLTARFVDEPEGRIITKDGVLIRQGGDVFMPVAWKKERLMIMAYSEDGYVNRKWRLLPEWGGVEEIDVYLMTENGPQKAETRPVEDGWITLSLEEKRAAVIVPCGEKVC